jgi:hypothetical protein
VAIAAYDRKVAGQEAGRVYRIGFLAGSAREEAQNAAFFDELAASASSMAKISLLFPADFACAANS